MGEEDSDLLLRRRPVVLAHQPAFRLGSYKVEPATRQISSNGRSQTIEPRIMQVLVALVRADGRIVTRDELVQQCWEGRIVGDDAVNRVLSRIRRLAEADGGSFAIETIPRVGYRLQANGAAGPVPAALAPSTDRRTLLLAGSAIAVAASVAGAGLWMRQGVGIPPEAKQFFDRAFALRFTGLPEDNRQAIAYLREAVSIAPQYGEAWGALALAYRSAIQGEPADQTEGFENLMAEALHRADRFDPGNADAAAARVPIMPLMGHWRSYEQASRQLIRAHPQHFAGYNWLGAVLMDVGRWADAALTLAAAHARNAYSPIVAYKLILSLWSAGRLQDADAALDQALQRWPGHAAIWQTQLKILAFTGRPRAALALLNDPASRPVDERSRGLGARELVLRAQISRSAQDIRAAIDALVGGLRADPRGALPVALDCSTLGESQVALEIVEGLFLAEGGWSQLHANVADAITHPLFQPPMRPLWREPRFGRITERIGLEDYWRKSGTPPDFRRS